MSYKDNNTHTHPSLLLPRVLERIRESRKQSAKSPKGDIKSWQMCNHDEAQIGHRSRSSSLLRTKPESWKGADFHRQHGLGVALYPRNKLVKRIHEQFFSSFFHPSSLQVYICRDSDYVVDTTEGILSDLCYPNFRYRSMEVCVPWELTSQYTLCSNRNLVGFFLFYKDCRKIYMCPMGLFVVFFLLTLCNRKQ